jgi:glutamine amidotransferase
MIAIIDYGAGNLRSVRNALVHLGAEVKTVDDPANLTADKIVLPGVGAFGKGIERLRAAGFEEPLKEAAAAGTPLLGICLGMQFLFEQSDELGQHEGLALLPGRVTRFPNDGPKVPHIGWNQIDIETAHPLLDGVPDGAYAYFVHSYYPVAEEASDILATTDYGLRYASVAGRDNVYGIQFHPEKSQAIGLRILNNFVAMESAR